MGLARALGAPAEKTPHTAHPCWPLGGQSQASLEQSPGARPGGPRRLLTSEGRVPGREVLALPGRTCRAPLCPAHRLQADSRHPLGHTAQQEGPGHSPGCEASGTPGGSLYPFHRGGSQGVGETPHHCSRGHAGSPPPQPLPQAGQLPGTGGLRPVRGRPGLAVTAEGIDPGWSCCSWLPPGPGASPPCVSSASQNSGLSF